MGRRRARDGRAAPPIGSLFDFHHYFTSPFPLRDERGITSAPFGFALRLAEKAHVSRLVRAASTPPQLHHAGHSLAPCPRRRFGRLFCHRASSHYHAIFTGRALKRAARSPQASTTARLLQPARYWAPGDFSSRRFFDDRPCSISSLDYLQALHFSQPPRLRAHAAVSRQAP